MCIFCCLFQSQMKSKTDFTSVCPEQRISCALNSLTKVGEQFPPASSHMVDLSLYWMHRNETNIFSLNFRTDLQ